MRTGNVLPVSQHQIAKATSASASTKVQQDKVISRESIDIHDRGLMKRPHDPEILLALYESNPALFPIIKQIASDIDMIPLRGHRIPPITSFYDLC